MNISSFRSMFKAGFARATRYSVEWADNTLYPESITLPSKSVSVYTHSLFGPIVQYPYRDTYNDNIVMTFPEAASGSMRMFWESKMNSAGGGAAFPGKINTQVANLSIHQLDGYDRTIATYSVYGAYPVSIVPVNMGYGMVNETTKVQVMIKYYSYEYDTMKILPTTPTQPGQVAQGIGMA